MWKLLQYLTYMYECVLGCRYNKAESLQVRIQQTTAMHLVNISNLDLDNKMQQTEDYQSVRSTTPML